VKPLTDSKLAREVARRKTAEHELRKRSRVIEQSPSAVVITDTQGRIEYVNPAFCAVTGYSAEDVVGQNPSILNSGMQDAALYRELWTSIRGGEVWRGELANKRKNGEIFWEQAAISPIFDEQGVITHFCAVKEDNTERKRAETELAASERRFRALFEAATIPHAEMAASGHIIGFNAKFTETFGWTLDDVSHIDDWWEKVYPDPAYRAATMADWLGAVAAADPERQDVAPREYRMTCKDGSEKIVLISQRQAGESLVASFVDVTETRRYERALQDQLHLQEALIDTIPNPIFIKDAAARFIGCNRAYEQAFGTTRAFMRGKTVMDLHYLPLEARVAYQAEDTAVIAEGGLRHHELRMRLADGEEHDVLYWVAGFARSDGGRGGLIGIIVDISALKEAQRLAEEATRAKSEFLANMSHEIRTPMNIILGMTHLLRQGELKPQSQEYLSRIENAGRALMRLIDDILDFSRIETGRLDLETRPFQLHGVLAQVREILLPDADAKGLALRIEVAPAVPATLFGDPRRLHQMLFHLAGNAVKFTERGEVLIRVRLEEADQTRVRLHVAVRDTGIGLSEADQTKVFQAFSQADGSITRRHGGTGLGLAIAKRLSELMDGTMGVDSQLGEGSTFWFTACFGLEQDKPALDLFALAHMAGFAITDKLEKLGGNARLYRDLLVKFAIQQRQAPAHLGELIAGGDLLAAWREVHSLKGVAAMLGHEALAETAGRLEQRLQEASSCPVAPFVATGDPEPSCCGSESAAKAAAIDNPRTHVPDPVDVASEFTELTKQLNAVLAALMPLLREDADTRDAEAGLAAGAPMATAAARLIAVLDELAPEIRARRATRCRDGLRKLQILQWPEALAAEAREFERLLGRYQYQQALPLLERLRGGLVDSG
jgi:PAS domain S-box-containing protein